MPRKTTTRNAQGAGSIRQRPDGRWEARYTVGSDPGTGKPVRKSIYGSTQAEVRKRLTAALRSLDQNTYTADDRRTVGAYLDSWMADFIEPVQKPYTVTTYRGVIKNHLKPHIGAVRLCDLTTEQVQKMVRQMVKDGKAPKTIKNIVTVLSSALEQCVKSGTLARNPARYVRLPAVRVKDIQPLNAEQIAAFVAAAEGSRYYAPLMCCLFLGLREGEALGLAWDNVDLEKRTVLICQQLQREKAKDGKAYIEDSTKNGRSRLLNLPDFMVDILKAEKQRQLLERIAAGPAWVDRWGLCFTNPVGECIQPKTFWAHFKKLAKQAGVPDARVHDLRHTNATLALLNGDDIKTVQANMGHATAAFTLQRYIHASEQAKLDSANRMQQFFADSVQKKA